MAPVYTGTLPSKKKSELQDIALALRISDQGTKDEIHNRIKKHLDANQSTLEDDPMFTGLFARRKRSVQPQQTMASTRATSSEGAAVKHKIGSSLTGAHKGDLDSIQETSPTPDLRHVSTLLKHPVSPNLSTPFRSPRAVEITPSSLPPLPPSPPMSLAEQNVQQASVNGVIQLPRITQNDILIQSRETWSRTQHLLSNLQNLWSLSAVVEIVYILWTVIPWRSIQVSTSPKGGFSPLLVTVTYPPWHTFQTQAFWMVIFHWTIPSLVIPAIAGNLVSFNPLGHESRDVAPFDPLSASIVRVAAQIAYPFALLEERLQMTGLDVLGFKWRVLAAGVALAFAFAQAIAIAPQSFVQTMTPEQKVPQAPGSRPSQSHLSLESKSQVETNGPSSIGEPE